MLITVIVNPLPGATARTNRGADRTISLFYPQTGETAKITFWRKGKFDSRGMAELSKFLRDWRRNQPGKIDPNLINLVWQIYQDVKATRPITIVSAYRSPQTNEMLRARSSGVAKSSRHTKGQAMDFYIPGVPLAKLRAAAMRRQGGGVGYYPTSGSPFVHVDTGGVRAWPRMNRAQLTRIFPDGKTLHLPPSGVPLSESGRRYAMAQWQKCNAVPCGRNSGSFVPFSPATTASGADNRRQVTAQPVRVARAPTPPVRPFRLDAPTTIPQLPAFGAPVPPTRTAIASVPSPTVTPVPRVAFDDSAIIAAYAATTPTPGQSAAQRALETLIAEANREAAGAFAADAPIITASIAPGPQSPGPDASFTDIFGLLRAGIGRRDLNAPHNPADNTTPPTTLAVKLTRASFSAPDFEHVGTLMTDPTLATDRRFGLFYEPDTPSFDPATGLGPAITRIRFATAGTFGLSSAGFIPVAPIHRTTR
ncbi:MAG: DUF882 domain-containing protein [Alphaproteobacteria bacterium]|nr:DUF882 domain-containing protein [Alphaproteobacteria bacterium]